jgi:putative flippase GtrA
MLSRLQRCAAPVFLRYVLASVGALAVDMGAFLAGLALGVPAVAASVLGYALGIAAHWVLSSTVVFADDVAAAGAARRRQQALFVASALVGLGVTALVVGGLARLGLDPRAAKLAAVGFSFVVTWLLRQRVVFR